MRLNVSHGHHFRYQAKAKMDKLCNFLLVNNTNLQPISLHFQDVRDIGHIVAVIRGASL